VFAHEAVLVSERRKEAEGVVLQRKLSRVLHCTLTRTGRAGWRTALAVHFLATD